MVAMVSDGLICFVNSPTMSCKMLHHCICNDLVFIQYTAMFCNVLHKTCYRLTVSCNGLVMDLQCFTEK